MANAFRFYRYTLVVFSRLHKYDCLVLSLNDKPCSLEDSVEELERFQR